MKMPSSIFVPYPGDGQNTMSRGGEIFPWYEDTPFPAWGEREGGREGMVVTLV